MSIESKYKSLFEKGEHSEAIELLKKNQKDFDPALYHYNLGVNYVRMEKLAEGRYQFEMAKQKGLYSPELRESLEELKRISGTDRMEEKSSAMDYVYDLSLGSSLYTGVNVSLILLIVLLTQIRNIPKWWLKAILALVALSPLGLQLYMKANYSESLAMESKPVLMGPSKIFEESQELLPGMKVVLSKDMNGWRYVVAPASHRGWVRSDNLKDL